MINNVSLVGRAGKDPEVRILGEDNKVCNISMAVQRRSKEKQTDWFNIEIWGKAAEVCQQYVRKGHVFGVEGRLQTWEKDGKRGVTIVANNLSLMPNATSDGDDDQSEEQSAPQQGNVFAGAKTPAY